MTLSANFTPKSVFELQGCRALTFALARLSCYAEVMHGIDVEIKPLVPIALSRPSCHRTANKTGGRRNADELRQKDNTDRTTQGHR